MNAKQREQDLDALAWFLDAVYAWLDPFADEPAVKGAIRISLKTLPPRLASSPSSL